MKFNKQDSFIQNCDNYPDMIVYTEATTTGNQENDEKDVFLATIRQASIVDDI